MLLFAAEVRSDGSGLKWLSDHCSSLLAGITNDESHNLQKNDRDARGGEQSC